MIEFGHPLPTFLPAIDPEGKTIYDVSTEAGQRIQEGGMPDLENFTFTLDRRPDGHEDDLIPADEFTGYFADGQVPLADRGSPHRHDLAHVPAYQVMFRNPLFAQTVRTAARNAVSGGEVDRFTGSLDNVTDFIRAVLLQATYGTAVRENDLDDARAAVGELVELSTERWSADSIDERDRARTLYRTVIENDLGITAAAAHTMPAPEVPQKPARPLFVAYPLQT